MPVSRSGRARTTTYVSAAPSSTARAAGASSAARASRRRSTDVDLLAVPIEDDVVGARRLRVEEGAGQGCLPQLAGRLVDPEDRRHRLRRVDGGEDALHRLAGDRRLHLAE